MSCIFYYYLVDIAVQVEQTTCKEMQLQAVLDTTKCVSRAKDQQISMLEVELQKKEVKMSSLSYHFEQQQRELEMVQQKGKWNNGVDVINESIDCATL